MVSCTSCGGLAQLVRASASHAEGHRFESATLHHVGASYVSLAPLFLPPAKKQSALTPLLLLPNRKHVPACDLPFARRLWSLRHSKCCLNEQLHHAGASYVSLAPLFCLRQKKQSALTPLLLLPNRKHVPACDLPFTMRLWSRRHPKRRLDEQLRHAGASYVSLAPAF